MSAESAKIPTKMVFMVRAGCYTVRVSFFSAKINNDNDVSKLLLSDALSC